MAGKPPVHLPPSCSLGDDPAGMSFVEVSCNKQGVMTLLERLYPRGFSLAQLEALAERHPDNDWRIAVNDPMRRLVYQRQGPQQWCLVYLGPGFA